MSYQDMVGRYNAQRVAMTKTPLSFDNLPADVKNNLLILAWEFIADSTSDDSGAKMADALAKYGVGIMGPCIAQVLQDRYLTADDIQAGPDIKHVEDIPATGQSNIPIQSAPNAFPPAAAATQPALAGFLPAVAPTQPAPAAFLPAPSANASSSMLPAQTQTPTKNAFDSFLAAANSPPANVPDTPTPTGRSAVQSPSALAMFSGGTVTRAQKRKQEELSVAELKRQRLG